MNLRQERRDLEDTADGFSRLLGEAWEAVGDGTYRLAGDEAIPAAEPRRETDPGPDAALVRALSELQRLFPDDS